jgi:hypothetical protein
MAENDFSAKEIYEHVTNETTIVELGDDSVEITKLSEKDVHEEIIHAVAARASDCSIEEVKYLSMSDVVAIFKAAVPPHMHSDDSELMGQTDD